MSAMDSKWLELLEPMLNQPSISVDEVAAMLQLRGQHALAGGGAAALDERLLALGEGKLEQGACIPGAEVLRGRWAAAAAIVDDLDDDLARDAEEVLAGVLDQCDQWAVRATALEALGLRDAAARVWRAREALEQALGAKAAALEALGYLAAARRGRIVEKARSTWRLVPAAPPAEAGGPAPWGDVISDEDLAAAALGRAPVAVRRRLGQALESDAEVRARYEDYLDMATDFQSAMAGPVTVRQAPAARRRSGVAYAAADRPLAQFEPPPPEALLHLFPDGSELYAERDGDAWLIRLYRSEAHADDRIEPLEASLAKERILGGWTRRGTVVVRYGGVSTTWCFDAPG